MHETTSILFYILYLETKSRKVVPGRLELPTSTLSVWRSNQLSYRTVQAAWVSTQLLSILYLQTESEVQEAKGFQTNLLFITTYLQIIITNYSLLITHYLSVLSRKEVFPDLLDFARRSVSCVRNPFQDSPERRCSSRTFRYGYLVTT